jgi:hypothetical protein
MGTLKTLWIAFKARQGRPLSRSDLFSYCEDLIRKPPVLPNLQKAFEESFVRSSGEVISLSVVYRRDRLIPALERIATQPTWHFQRTECLKAVLDDLHWHNWYFCLNNAKSPAGRGMILGKLKHVWPKASDEELTHYLNQFFVVSLACYAALGAVGETFFKFDDKKKKEIDLYVQYQREIMKLDTDFMDLIYEHCENDIDAALKWADWKDAHLNPIMQKMYNHLSAIKDQIIQDVFDPEACLNRMEELRKQRTSLIANVKFDQ